MITLKCVKKITDEAGTTTVFNAISDDANTVVFGEITVIEAVSSCEIGKRYNDKFEKVADADIKG